MKGATCHREARSDEAISILPCGRLLWVIVLMATIILASCAPVDLDAPAPTYDTGVDSTAWAKVPAGTFLLGQHHEDEATIENDYEIMVTDVTVAQYVEFLNAALADGSVKVSGDHAVAFYPGDPFHGKKHEIRIDAGDYPLVPLNDPASRFTFDGQRFAVKAGWENHPMTNVSWFGAWAYCGYYGWRLPTEKEWVKAARGTDDRAYPWGDEITVHHANFYHSRDPFEDMWSYGSRTTPVGFYNGKSYDGFQTVNAASPYGLYDMAGNVWQWVGDVQIQEGFSDRLMHGGSKDTYDADLRVWVRNSAPPMYYGPGVGFRCAKMGDER